jgi:hypothetical protein
VALTLAAASGYVTPTPIITLAELAAFAKTPPTDDLQPYVDAACSRVEGKVGPHTADPYRWTVAPRGPLLILPAPRITEVSALAGPDTVDAWASLLAADVDWSAGIIDLAGTAYWSTWSPLTARTRAAARDAHWTVTVRHDRSAADTAAIKLAAQIIGKHLWELQRGRAARASAYGEPADAGQVAGPAYAIPNRAAELLGPYCRDVVIE